VITVEVWLYGALARYGGDEDKGAYAHLYLDLPAGSVMADLLRRLEIPAQERGVTFINSVLSAMAGLQPDLEHQLADQDRVGIFPVISALPYHDRATAAMTPEMRAALERPEASPIHNVLSGGTESPLERDTPQ